MAQRTALGSPHQIDEHLALGQQAIFKFFLRCQLHRIDALGGRGKVFRHALDHVAGKLKIRRALGVLARQIPHQGEGGTVGRMLGCHFTGEGQRLLSQTLRRSRQLVEQFLTGQHRQHLALDGFATDDDVQRGLHAQDTRQALRATRPRNQAQLDLGQRHIAARRSDAVMRPQRQLQAAAHAHAVHSSHDRLGGVFHGTNHAQ